MSAKRHDIDTERMMARLRQSEYRRLRDHELRFHDVADQLRMSQRRMYLLRSGRGSRRLDRISPDDLERCRAAIDEKQVKLLVIRREISRREDFLALLERCQTLFSRRRRSDARRDQGVECTGG